jgi:L-ascorbate metabolism protein UlaG (beta-lactamase superfamily)
MGSFLTTLAPPLVGDPFGFVCFLMCVTHGHQDGGFREVLFDRVVTVHYGFVVPLGCESLSGNPGHVGNERAYP